MYKKNGKIRALVYYCTKTVLVEHLIFISILRVIMYEKSCTVVKLISAFLFRDNDTLILSAVWNCVIHVVIYVKSCPFLTSPSAIYKNLNVIWYISVIHVIQPNMSPVICNFMLKLGLIIIPMSHLVTKPTKWHVHPAKTQISLGIRPGWSESSLGAQSLCWFCHEAAHIVMINWTFLQRQAIEKHEQLLLWNGQGSIILIFAVYLYNFRPDTGK